MNQDNEDQLEPTFRIRLTISNNSYRETSHTSDSNNDSHSEESSNQQHTGDSNKHTKTKTNEGNQNDSDVNKRKFFKLVQPQNHKSSLFVNLSQQQASSNHLFISPDLNRVSPSTPPFPADESNSNMSQGCNFINSWVTASRRRSASVTPQPPAAKPGLSVNNSGRRASSSDDLVVPADELGVGISNETVCPRLQVDVSDCQNHTISLADVLQIDLDKLQLEDEIKNLESQVEYWEHKVDDLERKRFGEDVPRTLVENVLKQRKRLRELDFQIYKLDLETEEYEKQSRKFSPLSNEAMSNNLSPQSHDSHLLCPSHEQDARIKNIEYIESPIRELVTSRFGSHIRPGQENTADILEAIPPSGSLQHKQYLTKASTVTDTSEYAHMPTYNQHKHQLPRHLGASASSDDSSVHTSNSNDSNLRSSTRQQLRHHSRFIEQQQVYVQLGSEIDRKSPSDRGSNNRHRFSPIRPNHFKDDFKSPTIVIDSQDSSSTSSGSPQCPIKKLFR